jgi:hypothetical protein
MTVIDLLGDHIHGSSGSLQLGAVDDQLTFGCASRIRRGGRSSWHVPNGNLAELSVGSGCDAVHLDALIHDSVVVYNVIVDDCRVVVDTRYLGPGKPAVGIVVLMKVVERNESEVVGAQTEIEVQTHMNAVIAVA